MVNFVSATSEVVSLKRVIRAVASGFLKIFFRGRTRARAPAPVNLSAIFPPVGSRSLHPDGRDFYVIIISAGKKSSEKICHHRHNIIIVTPGGRVAVCRSCPILLGWYKSSHTSYYERNRKTTRQRRHTSDETTARHDLQARRETSS